MNKMKSSQFKISGLLQLTFLGSKTNSHWRPILRLNKPSLSETIRTSLQQGEWVTSVDFKDAYFHIPIQEQSRKYLRFHIQGQANQFNALPFGLPTAPMEVTVIPKAVKLMAIHKGLRIHQYVDWLVRACLQHTLELVKKSQQLGWLVKSELEPKQDFDFVGYQFDLRSGRVRLTPDRRQNLQEKILKLLSLPACPVREFMPLIGFTNSYRKTSSSRPTSYKTHSVASLEGFRITEKGDPNPQVPAPPFTMVAEGRQCTYRPTITPNKTFSANI